MELATYEVRKLARENRKLREALNEIQSVLAELAPKEDQWDALDFGMAAARRCDL